MEIRHKEIEIDKENPFANCELEREKYALVLSDIVNTYAKGFVLAINNEWGTGNGFTLQHHHSLYDMYI